ncbi:MAG: septal ring lytic transglycosylase RlpA family protein [Bacteroidota bacterium]|nr:septal ring lytic transglycosylase RlpA family protein [Bacteroidota bacterium]MDP4232533.1 septal ring lytic transglycosylase RlpA family protein [Bacteroidota bacterium]MDP4241668.1 septal ring lytic transglycosylase RlpA family protein [Bacteroidota bacterium]MDP4286413.1 septal ring lytic transglycosylase RlpA family protein [Bacteroidota bacterium]
MNARRIVIIAAVLSLTSVVLSSCAVHSTIRAVATQEGLASYYSNDFQGRRTSSGEIFDNSRFTAAHRTYPFGTVVRVTNLESDAVVTVRINDRGPVKPERIIDLSYAAAQKLGILRSGLGHVRIDVVEWGRPSS